ncbi:hypothetical protein SAMN05421504_10488 [Amycolatopsis xylanica]|uniref:Uncharacterized protein n=1 Tax=Amycolatopsis xylanica TaxID=589385 RepID=A0A1H3G4B0_9PSEU|nr:hypothetical protein [Amycolatopsis xylanica]SDX97209.1 hypothetical protein SAMN05421504_10488 [Amycolatopsis xylanica]
MKSEEKWPTSGQAPKTLTWHGDGLADWVSGYTWYPDGPVDGGPQYPFSGSYDGATVSPSGRYQVIYHEYGLDGLLLDRGEPLRELTRDDDDPDAFFYPVTFGRLADGREVLIHCPERRDRLEIELPETGERLTSRPLEEGVYETDIYHSRLAVSPGGRWLLSAGWVWHPAGVAQVYDLTQALAEPAVLDAYSSLSPPDELNETVSACWLDDDRLAAFSISWNSDDWPQLADGSLGVWSMKAAAWESQASYGEHLGTIARFGEHLLSFYDYPKLIDPSTGAVVASWPHLPSGKRMLPYGLTYEPETVAVHPDGTRFAVAAEDFITVVEWS